MTLVAFNTLMRDAVAKAYAVGYFESWNLESLLAVADAAEATRSPVILGFSGIYLPHPQRVVKDPLDVYASMGLEVCRRISVPACLLFNESPSIDWVKDALRAGFGLVMYSDDQVPEKEREEKIVELAQLAHRNNQAVEAELCALPGVAGDGVQFDKRAPLTEPSAAAAFVRKTKIDALAVDVGQQHLHGQREVTLNLERLAALRAAVDVPLVLHGATSVRHTDVRQAVEIGIRKVNVGSALKQAYSGALSQKCRECSENSNPYEVIGSGLLNDVLVAGRLAIQHVAEDWMRTIRSAGRANAFGDSK
jgi:fructose/tagatose bisphosphate aldolase